MPVGEGEREGKGTGMQRAQGQVLTQGFFSSISKALSEGSVSSSNVPILRKFREAHLAQPLPSSVTP